MTEGLPPPCEIWANLSVERARAKKGRRVILGPIRTVHLPVRASQRLNLPDDMAFLWWRCRCTGVSKGKRHALLCALRDWTEGYWSTFHRTPLFSSAWYQLKCIRNHYTVQRSLYLGKSLPRQKNVLVCLKQSIIAWSCYYFSQTQLQIIFILLRLRGFKLFIAEFTFLYYLILIYLY